MKLSLFICLMLMVSASFAQTVFDSNGILTDVEKIYSTTNGIRTIECNTYASLDKYLHGFSYDCSGETCDGEFETEMRESFNLTYFGCGTDDEYIVSTYGETYSLANLKEHKNMVNFFLNEMLGDYFYEDGQFQVINLKKTTFTYYEALPFRKTVPAYQLDVDYYPAPGSARWQLQIIFDPSQKLIKQILELKIQEESWFKLIYI